MTSAEAESGSIVEYLELDEADRVIIRHAPEGDLETGPVQILTVDEATTVQQLLDALRAIPARGPGILAKIASSAPEQQVEFYAGERQLGTLRVKGGSLDSPVGEGWSFYRGDDEAFCTLLERILL